MQQEPVTEGEITEVIASVARRFRPMRSDETPQQYAMDMAQEAIAFFAMGRKILVVR
jgi:hypothetical protein